MRLFYRSYQAAALLCLMLNYNLVFANENSTSAIEILLHNAKQAFEAKEYERSAAIIERALRIAPRNAVLWHNLAGISLKQNKWTKAASLAAKSNTFSQHKNHLRAQNWVVIATACKELSDKKCMNEAKRRVEVLRGKPQ